jgi:23S rRNA pseudouridine1911/1915/1917 synthase
MRLDLALIRQHPGLSRRKARQVIEKGQVTVDGKVALLPGEEVTDRAPIRWDPNRKAQPRARLALPLLHRDLSTIVVDKPAGLLAVPAPAEPEADTALARVREYVRHLTPRRPYVGVVHRLDRDTSGALAFALNPAMRESLRTLFREHRIERRYLALVVGSPRQDRGVVDAPIHDLYVGGRRRVAGSGEPSRPALTRFVVVERFEGAALLEVDLETGRQHQIRIHLAHVGLPVLGDPVYGQAGRRSSVVAPRQMLHARRLAFIHPETSQRIEVESPLPEDFRRALKELRRRSPHPVPPPRRGEGKR